MGSVDTGQTSVLARQTKTVERRENVAATTAIRTEDGLSMKIRSTSQKNALTADAQTSNKGRGVSGPGPLGAMMTVSSATPAVVPRAYLATASAWQGWALDSGETQHLTSDGTALENVKPASTATSVKIADEWFVEVKGYRKLELLVK